MISKLFYIRLSHVLVSFQIMQWSIEANLTNFVAMSLENLLYLAVSMMLLLNIKNYVPGKWKILTYLPLAV